MRRALLAFVALLLAPAAAMAQTAWTFQPGSPTYDSSGNLLTGITAAALNAASATKQDYNTSFIVGPTVTSSPASGLIYSAPASWSPPGAPGQWNFYQLTSTTVSLSSGTVAQRWSASNMADQITLTTTGPTGTPSSPSGMADSHTIAYSTSITIPAGLCDGQNGSGFSGAGGSPGNNCYQEIAGFESANTVLSPGHYAEGIGSYINDNSGGSGAVPARMTGFFAAVNKAYAGNTYPVYGFQADSYGAQQGADAPNAAFRADGGFQIGLDLTGLTYTGGIAIALTNGIKFTTDSSNLYLAVQNANALTINAVQAAFAGTVRAPNFTAGSTAGASCSGTPSSSFASIGGIVTHC